MATSTMALALLLAFFLAAQDKPPEKCTLSGTVVSSVSGEPLNHVEVFAEPVSGGTDATTTTDDKSNFKLVDLAPGEYKLKGRRNGYLDTYYGARRATGGGAMIALEPGCEIKDIQIKLRPFAVLAGTVRETDGEPLAGAQVAVFTVKYWNGLRSIEQVADTHTDDLGQYRISNLPPGKYYLRADPHRDDEPRQAGEDHSPKSAPPEALLPALYPGVVDPAAARPVETAAGARIAGLDIALPRSRVFRVSGRVIVPAGTTGSVVLEAALGFEALGPSYNADPNPKGDFEITGLSRLLHASMQLEVGNADVTGVRIAVAPGAEVQGHIVMEGDDPAKLTNSFVEFEDASGFSSETPILEDQTFASLLSPGNYKVWAIVGNLKLVTKSIRAGQTDVLRDGLTVSEAGGISLEIVLSHDGGQIDGVALDKDDKPVEGATVLLVPEAPFRGIEDTSTDQYGRYKFENVPPGDYKLFAWDDVEPGAWFDPEFLRGMESSGQAVKLDAKGRETAKVHLPGAK
jgi:hypothetical protein